MADREHELVAKLLETGHLNVPERRELPGARIRYSVARSVILERLQGGWFPGTRGYPAEDEGGEYLQLENRDGGCVLHRNTEAGLTRFVHRSESFDSLDDAIEAYLRERERRDLDGLTIDWEA